MYLHYLFSALRHLKRNKSYSLISIFGLAVGLAAVMLILMFIRSESRYDHFHEKADRLYRVAGRTYENGQLRWDNDYIMTAAPGPVLKAEIPEVEEACCVNESTFRKAFRYEMQEPMEARHLRYVDHNFLQLFSFEMLHGDPLTALKEPFSLVLSSSEALKFFGDEEAMGKTLGDEKGDVYTVTGIVKDPPRQTDLYFGVLVSMQTRYSTEPARMFGWNGGNQFMTYVLLREGAKQKDVETKILGLVEKYKNEIGNDNQWHSELFLQPLKQNHVHHNYESFLLRIYFYVFGGVALLILFIACINFVNLMMARAVDYAKEVGVRKVLGDNRHGILRLFLLESLVSCLFAFLLAFVLAYLAVPVYTQITGTLLRFSEILSVENLLIFIALLLLVGLSAGAYPSLYLSSFQAAMVEKAGKSKKGGLFVRNSLIVFQFFVSIILIIAVLVLSRQMQYAQNFAAGFEKENVLCLYTPQAALLKQSLQGRPYVQEMALSSEFPGVRQERNGYGIEGHSGSKMVVVTEIEASFLSFYRIPILQGRDFSGDKDSDRNYILVNECFAKMYGWEDPIGKAVQRGNRTRTVIGVIPDIHMESLRERIEPLILTCYADYQVYNRLSIKYQAGNLSAMLDDIEAIWKDLHPVRPFRYDFLEDYIRKEYDYEQKFQKAFFWFALFAILLAVLGVYSLMTYTVSRRRKEIGIRKVMGASVGGIILLLSKDFLRLVLVANLLAIPTAWYGVSMLMRLTAYHVPVGWLMFVAAMLISFVVAGLAMVSQALKAAMSNPVNSISTE